MHCSNCGAELNQGVKFCHHCGAKQAVGPPSAPPERPPQVGDASLQVYAPPPPVQETVAENRAQLPQKKRRGCCGWGCLVVGGGLVVLLLLLGWIGARETGLLARVGLEESVAERVLSDEPDRATARAIMNEIKDEGIDTEGLYIYVLPFKDSSQQLAYAVLDAGAGFTFSHSGEYDALTYMLLRLADSEAARAANIARVAIDYRSEAGDQVVVITAPVDKLRAFARGEIGEEELNEALDADFDMANAYHSTLRWIQ